MSSFVRRARAFCEELNLLHPDRTNGSSLSCALAGWGEAMSIRRTVGCSDVVALSKYWLGNYRLKRLRGSWRRMAFAASSTSCETLWRWERRVSCVRRGRVGTLVGWERVDRALSRLAAGSVLVPQEEVLKFMAQWLRKPKHLPKGAERLVVVVWCRGHACV